MATTFFDLKLWKDIGYTDGSSEIPPVGHTLGTPDLTYNTPFIPSKERFFSEMQLPLAYLGVLPMSYLQVTVNFNNPNSSLPQTFYGWIDDVLLQSDTTSNPMVLIKWHVDLWRTFNSGAEYGSGFVVRRPSGDSDFYQNYPYNHKKRGSVSATILPVQKTADNNHAIMWLIFAVVKEDHLPWAPDITSQTFVAYPFLRGSVHDFPVHVTIGSDDCECPTERMTLIGAWDEFFNLDPQRVTAVWMSPVCPFLGHSYSINFEGDKYVFHDSGDPVGWTKTKDPFRQGTSTWSGFWGFVFTGDKQVELSGSLPLALRSQEGLEYRVTGFNGECIGTLPYLYWIEDYKVRLKLSAVSALFEIRFGDIYSSNEGLQFDIPLMDMDSNENSWSSYYYSGQREYDKTQRQTRSMSGMIEGVAQGATIGALIGAGTKNNALSGGQVSRFTKTIGALGGVAGGPAGMLAGAAIGSIGSAVGGVLDLGVFNDMFQQSEDRYHANQPEGIITSGFGADTAAYGQGINIISETYDDYSLTAMSAMKEVQGVLYNAPVQDCTSLISIGGPLQITNLIVKGDIPVVAKRWIKQKFADGVRIVSRS